MRCVFRRKETTRATKRVGIDGGFCTNSHRAGAVSYPSTQKRVQICHRTFNGPEMMNGMDLDLNAAGGGDKGWILTRGLLSRSG
jgi:hypothetical protein